MNVNWEGTGVCIDIIVCCSVLQCVAVCCSVLQCVAVCCSVVCIQISYTYIVYVCGMRIGNAQGEID